MKTKAILISLFSFLAICSQAQSFINTSKVWTVSEKIFDGSEYTAPSTLQFNFNGDSTLDAKQYSKMYSSKNFGDSKFHSLWREDSLGNVYCKQGRDIERLLYNFSVTEADTFELDGNLIVVDSISIKPFGRVSKKHFYLHNTNLPNYSYVWIEGVGSLFAPHIADAYFLVGGKYSLVCFDENGTQVYQNPDYTSCNANSGTLVNSKLNANNLIKCFWEPGGLLRIQNFTNTPGQILLFDLKGQNLYKAQLNAAETEICLPYSGIIIYQFDSKDGQVQSGKIVLL